MNMQNSKTADEAKIRILIDQRARALHAKDAQAVLACLTSDFVAFDRAIALANTSAEAAHIRMHLDRLKRDSAPRGAKAGK